MDNQEILQTIKQYLNLLPIYFKRLGPWIKETLQLPYVKAYILFSLLLMILFTILFFPYDRIIRDKMLRLSNGPLYDITIPADTEDKKVIDYSLLGTSSFQKISLYIKKDQWIKWNQLEVEDVISLGGLYDIYFKQLFQGSCSIVNFEYGSPKIILKCNLNTYFDFNLLEKTNGQIAANKNKMLNTNKSKNIQNGSIDLSASNVRLNLKELDMLSMVSSIINVPKQIKFNILKVNAEIKNGKLKIKKFSLKGSDISGSITGSVQLQEMVSTSPIDLTVVINKNSKIISDNMQTLQPFIQQLLDSKGNIKIKIRGTLGQPAPDIKMGGMSPMESSFFKEKNNRTLSDQEPVFPPNERITKRMRKERHRRIIKEQL